MGYYDQATEDFRKGGKLEDIRGKVLNASDYFAKSLDVAKAGEAAFSAALAARTDALSTGAPTQQPELWKKGEETFNRAASELEDGDAESGDKLGASAVELYRTAELEAIKSNYLSPARILIGKGEKAGVAETAQKTFARARELAARAEELLKQNRYDTDEARMVAQEARYEADHALAIHEAVGRMKADDVNYEATILGIEEQFGRTSAALGLRARFDRGFEPPATEAVEAVKERDAEIAKAAEALEQATADLKPLTADASPPDSGRPPAPPRAADDQVARSTGSTRRSRGVKCDSGRCPPPVAPGHRSLEALCHDGSWTGARRRSGPATRTGSPRPPR